MNRLCSPDFWVGLACASCAIGILLILSGMIADAPTLWRIGLVPIAPLIFGGIGIVLIVVPILVVLDHRHDP